MIAEFPSERVRTDSLDDAGSFMAGAYGPQRRWKVAGHVVVIGMAEARRHHTHEQLALLRVIQLEIGDLPFLAHTP